MFRAMIHGALMQMLWVGVMVVICKSMVARFFDHFCASIAEIDVISRSQRPAMCACGGFLWALAGCDDNRVDQFECRRRMVRHIDEEPDNFNFDHHPLFGPSSESDTMDRESVTTLPMDSDVDWPCQHFFIGDAPHAKPNPTADPPPYLAPPVIQPRRVPVRLYYQTRGQWFKELI